MQNIYDTHGTQANENINKQEQDNTNFFILFNSYVPFSPSITLPKSMCKNANKKGDAITMNIPYITSATSFMKYLISNKKEKDFNKFASKIASKYIFLNDQNNQDIKNLNPDNDKTGHFLLHDKTKGELMVDLMYQLDGIETKVIQTYTSLLHNCNKDNACNNALDYKKEKYLDVELYLKNENYISKSNISCAPISQSAWDMIDTKQKNCNENYPISQSAWDMIDTKQKNFNKQCPTLSFNKKYSISPSIKDCFAFYNGPWSLCTKKTINVIDIAKTKIINAGKHIVYTLSDITSKLPLAQVLNLSDLYHDDITPDKFNDYRNNHHNHTNNNESLNKAYEFNMFCELSSQHVLNLSFLLNKAFFDFKHMNSKILVVDFSPIKSSYLGEYKSTYQVTFYLPQKTNEIKKFIDSLLIFEKVASEIHNHSCGTNHSFKLKIPCESFCIPSKCTDLGFEFNLQIIKRNIDDDLLKQFFNHPNYDALKQFFDHPNFFNHPNYDALKQFANEQNKDENKFNNSISDVQNKRNNIEDEVAKLSKVFLDTIISQESINEDDFHQIIKIKYMKTEMGAVKIDKSGGFMDDELNHHEKPSCENFYFDKTTPEDDSSDFFNCEILDESGNKKYVVMRAPYKNIKPEEIKFIQENYTTESNYIKKLECKNFIKNIGSNFCVKHYCAEDDHIQRIESYNYDVKEELNNDNYIKSLGDY